MIEQIKYFISKGENNILLTTDNGKKTYEKLGLMESDLFSYKVIDSYYTESKYHIFISYILRLPKIFSLLKTLMLSKSDIIFCHSEFFPNSIPAYFLGKRYKEVALFFWFHMLAPSIFRGYEGEYTGRFYFPKLNIIHYKLDQFLYISFIKILKRGKVITVNPIYKEYLMKRFNNIYTVDKFGGESGVHVIEKYSGIQSGVIVRVFPSGRYLLT